VVMLGGQISAIALMYTISTQLIGEEYDPRFTQEHWPTAIGMGLYFLLMFSIRFIEGGTFVMYEMLWGCNVSMVMCVAAVLLGHPMLIATAAVTVSVDQTCWYAEVIVFLLTRKFPIGVAKYMAKPETSLLTKLTSLHHLWFLPFCFWLLVGFGGIRPWSMVPASMLTSYLATYCRLFTPEKSPLSRSLQHHLKQTTRTLNVNMAYGFWADIKLAFLHAFDHAHPVVYLLYISTLGNLIQGLPYLLFRLVTVVFY